MSEQLTELRFQVGEAWKGTYSSSTSYSNAAVVQDATGLSIYRSVKSGNVGHALTNTNWWKCIIDMSSIKSASDTIVALNSQIATAETGRVNAESARVSAESSRVTAETARATAETGRSNAETSRASAETSRANAETARGTAETARASAETSRASAETARNTAEGLRDSKESSRATAETNRASAEATRISNEATRVSQETARQGAETARQAAYVAAEGTASGSVAGDGSRWGSYKSAEAERQAVSNMALTNNILGIELDNQTTGLLSAILGPVTNYTDGEIDANTGLVTLTLEIESES